MRCEQCNERAQALCPRCFCRIIEKRVRKEISRQGGLHYGDCVALVDDGTMRSKAAERLLRSILKDGVSLRVSAPRENDYRARLTTLDDRAGHALREAIDNAPQQEEGARILHPLQGITLAELQEYARAKGVTGKIPQRMQLSRALDALERRYPGAKAGLSHWSTAVKELRKKMPKA